MRRFFVVIVAIAIAAAAAWGGLALWFRLPFADPAKAIVAGGFFVFGMLAAVAMARFSFRLPLAFAAGFLALLAWWSTIHPPAHADWAPDVARQVTGVQEGNLLTLKDVRNFNWRSDADFDERWETRSYDLSKLRGVDLFLSYWSGPKIAHVIVSFGFEGDRYLAWSVEVRRRRGGEFSPIADLFRTNPLVIVAADERDVIRVRSNVRGEDVQLFRLRAAPEGARKLLLEYVAESNALFATPRFYNSLLTNCATVVIRMMRFVGATVPFDWRLIANGFLSNFAYDRGALDNRLSFEELKARAHIAKRAQAADASPDFSRLIREGVPVPLP